MLCYRAGTSFANLLSPHYSRSMDGKRMLAKSIIKTNINLIPNYESNTLTVELYSLSTTRENIAAKEMCNILNKQNAIYPDTNLRRYYKMAT